MEPLRQRVANRIAARIFVVGWLFFIAVLLAFQASTFMLTRAIEWTAFVSTNLLLPALVGWAWVWVAAMFVEATASSQQCYRDIRAYVENPHDGRNPIRSLLEEVFRPVALVRTGDSRLEIVADFVSVLRNGQNPASEGANMQTLYNALERFETHLTIHPFADVVGQPSAVRGVVNLALSFCGLLGVLAGLHIMSITVK